MFGQTYFQPKRWYLEGIRLEEDDHITHLGVILANDTYSHATARIKATRRSFYALQGVDLCVNGSNPDTITHTFKTIVRPVLVHGLECVYQTKTALHKVEVSQAKLLIVIFRSMFLSTSRANTFYKFLLTQYMKGAHSSEILCIEYAVLVINMIYLLVNIFVMDVT